MIAKTIIDSVLKRVSQRTTMPDGSTVRRDADGRTWWEDRFGKLHREGGPAIEEPDGTGSWYWHGKLHREDGPAYVDSNSKVWYHHGQKHREDGPALVDSHTQVWYHNNKKHRLDGPAEINTDGSWYWYRDGKHHRDGDDPASKKPNGDKLWYKDGKLHRIGGPAYISGRGKKVWFANDRQFTEDEYYRFVDQDTGEVLLPPGKKTAHEIQYGL